MYKLREDHVPELVKLYEETNTPSDSLVQNRGKLDTFCSRFEQRVGVAYRPETIAKGLFNLRKRGRLPRLRFRVVQKGIKTRL